MSRAGRLIRVFFHDKEKANKLLNRYIHHRNLYAKGTSEIGTLIGVINFQGGMVTWLFLKSIFPNFPIWILVVGFIVAVVGRTFLKWYVGFIWDKKQLFHKETDWVNERNPAIKFIQTVLTKE